MPCRLPIARVCRRQIFGRRRRGRGGVDDHGPAAKTRGLQRPFAGDLGVRRPALGRFPSSRRNAGGGARIPSGRLSNANQRMAGGAALALLGDGGYARGARGAQLRDDLAPLEQAVPKDLLAIQLDDRARFLERWKTFSPRDPDARRRRPEKIPG